MPPQFEHNFRCQTCGTKLRQSADKKYRCPKSHLCGDLKEYTRIQLVHMNQEQKHKPTEFKGHLQVD